MNARAAVALLLVLAMASVADEKEVHSTNEGGGDSMSQRYSDPVFEEVRLDSFDSWPCSPQPDSAFRGIEIAAPREVYFVPGSRDPIGGTFALVPVCGTCIFEHGTLGLNSDFEQAITLVAVDAETHESFSGRPTSRKDWLKPPPPTRKGSPRTSKKGRVVQGYFNPNLVRILGLPEKEAEYIVYATLGTYKSNVVRVRLVESGR